MFYSRSSKHKQIEIIALSGFCLKNIKKNGIWQFSQNVRVDDESANASQYTLSMAFENGSVYIAWYDDRNKDLDIFFSTGRSQFDVPG